MSAQTSTHYDAYYGVDISEPECDETVSDSVAVSNGNTKPLFVEYQSDIEFDSFDDEQVFELSDSYDRPEYRSDDEEIVVDIAPENSEQVRVGVRNLVQAWRSTATQEHAPQQEFIDVNDVELMEQIAADEEDADMESDFDSDDDDDDDFEF